MNKDNLPERLQKDEDFGGDIGVEDIYDGETVKKADLSKFEDVFKKSRERSIALKRAIPKPKTSAPTKNIKTSAGKGKSQLSKSILKARLDNVIKQFEQKGIKGAVPAGIGGAALGGILGGPIGALAGGGLGTAAGHVIEEKQKKMEKGRKSRPKRELQSYKNQYPYSKKKKVEKASKMDVITPISEPKAPKKINRGQREMKDWLEQLKINEAGKRIKKADKLSELSSAQANVNDSIKRLGQKVKEPMYPKKMEKSPKYKVYAKPRGAEGPEHLTTIEAKNERAALKRARQYTRGMGRRLGSVIEAPKMEKAGFKTLAGTGVGAGVGAAVGGPIGAGIGGVAGHAIGSAFDKPKKPPMIKKDLLKSKAYLSVEKAINLIQGYQPMSDIAIRKAFGDQVPQQMQDSSSRPPEDWWSKCMSEIGDEQQCLMMWNKEASQSQAPWTEEKTEGEVEQPEPGVQGQEPTDYDNLGKWMGGALQGGTLSSLLGHPVAGQAIQAAGKEIGRKILGQEVDDEQAQKIGMAAFDAIENIINESEDDSMKKAWPLLAARMIPALARGAAKMAPSAATGYAAGQMGANRAMNKRDIEQKAVVQQLDKKIVDEAIPEKKPFSDFGGESEISEGSKVNIKSLTDQSETQDETGSSAKIDAKKIAHNYKTQ